MLVYLQYRRLEWKNFEITITDSKTINVNDVNNESKETLGNGNSHYISHLCSKNNCFKMQIVFIVNDKIVNHLNYTFFWPSP